MRIIAGRLRGRRIAVPPGAAIRPTGARAREALFNLLMHNPAFADTPLAGATVLDAFAGSGILGLEALSRGAGRVHFLDTDRRALNAIRAALEAFDAGAQAVFHYRDATAPGPAPAPASVVFLDPPYGSGLAAPALTALAEQGWLAPRAVAAVEHAATETVEPPAGFVETARRTYGRGAFLFLRRA